MPTLPTQTNYEEAFNDALGTARKRDVSVLEQLGAQPVSGNVFRLSVLDTSFLIDLDEGRIVPEQPVSAEKEVRIQWRILILRYLGAEVPARISSRWVTFPELEPAAAIYNKVFQGRVIGRFCATAGRNRETFVESAGRLGGTPQEHGDEAFRFDVFPELPVIVAWHAGDDELPPDASFLFQDNVTSIVSLEDVVVASENLVGRLQGTGW